MTTLWIILGAIIGSVVWYKFFYKHVYANAIMINPVMVYLRSWFVCVILTCVVIGIIPCFFSQKQFEKKAEKSAKKIQGSWKAGEIEYGIRAFDDEGELYLVSYRTNEYQVFIYDATNNQLLVGFVNPEEKTFRIEHRNENHEEYSYKTGWRKIKLKNDGDKVTFKRKSKKWDYYGKKVTRLYEPVQLIKYNLDEPSIGLVDLTQIYDNLSKKIMVEATLVETDGYRAISIGDYEKDGFEEGFMMSEIFEASYDKPSGVEDYTGENHVLLECIIEQVEGTYHLLLVSVQPYDVEVLKEHCSEEEFEKYREEEGNKLLECEGWYSSSSDELEMYIDEYDVKNADGSCGRICIYDKYSEELLTDSTYYLEETGTTDWTDYDVLYYFYDGEEIYYLGVDSHEEGVAIDYNTEYDTWDYFFKYDEEHEVQDYEEEYNEEYDEGGTDDTNTEYSFNELAGYEGEYVNFNGDSMMYIDEYDAPSSDGAVGNICIYEGDRLLVDTPYYIETSGNTVWSDWDYDALYYFYNGESIYYLGASSQGEGTVMNYNSEDRNIDCYSVCTR